jgi:imidazolonepropionase-like amidohydrolase
MDLTTQFEKTSERYNNRRAIFATQPLGVVKPGAFADMIAVDGDTIEDFSSMERIKFVMKNGTIHVGHR